jgi:hypothetical protein
MDPMKRYSRQRAKKGQHGMRTVDLAATSSTPSLQTSNHNRLPPLQFEPEPFLVGAARNRNSNLPNNNGDVPLSPTRPGRRSQSTDMSHPPVSPHGQGYGHGFGGQHTRSPSHGTAVSSGSTKPPLPPSTGLAPPPQRRFVLHTDAGSLDNINSGTLELPPTYNAAASGNLLEADNSASSNPTPSGGDASQTDGHSQPEGVQSSEDNSQPRSQGHPEQPLHLTVFNA